MAIKEGDWVEIDFVGRIKRTGDIFDLTLEDVAKKEGIYRDNQKYSSLKVKIGSRQLLLGLDKAIIGKEIGKEYTISVKPEEAFGRRNPKLIQLTSLSKLKQKGVNPVPGMPLNVDGTVAYVRSISGGRVILDFNHPLSGKELEYVVWIRKKIDKIEDKVKAICSLFLNLDEKDYSIIVKKDEVKIELKKDVPKNIQEVFKKQLIEEIKEIKKVDITSKKQQVKTKQSKSG